MKYRYQFGNVVYEVSLEQRGEGYRATINGEQYDLEVLDTQDGTLTLHTAAEGDVLRPRVVFWAAEGDTRWLSSGGCTYRLDRPAERRRGKTSGATTDDAVRAPMPAQVRTMQVAAGDSVEAGQTLLFLEAMKMEIKLTAPRAGRIARVFVAQGETVDRDQILMELE